MDKPNKSVKVYTRCTPEFAEEIDRVCETKKMVRPSDGRAVRSQWIEEAMDNQMQIENREMELVPRVERVVVPVHPFATDPRCRGEPLEQPAPRHAGGPRDVPEPEPQPGTPGVFQL